MFRRIEGIRRGIGVGGNEQGRRKRDDGKHDNEVDDGHENFFGDIIGIKGRALGMAVMPEFRPLRGLAGIGRRGRDADPSNQKDVEEEEDAEHGRQEGHMQGKKTVQGGARDVFTTPENMTDQVPDVRKGRGDVGHHGGGPKTQLAPG